MIGALRRLPALLILAAVVTRVAPAALSVLLLGDTRALLTPDSLQYLELAESLAWSGTFARDGAPEIFRTPLFPLLLVPGTWLGAPVVTTLVVQVALSVVVTALVFDTAVLLTRSPRVATAAAIIYLLEPGQPIWSSVILADALLTTVVTLLMWLAVRHAPMEGWRLQGVLLLAVVAAVGAYVKPPGYFLGVLFAIGFAAAWWRRTPTRVLASFVAVLLVVNGVVLAGWHLRNSRVAGYHGFSTQFERAAFMAAPAALEGVKSGDGFAAARERIDIATGGEREADAVRELRRSAMPKLFSSLPRYAWLHLKGSAVLLVAPGVYWWDLVLGRDIQPTFIGSSFQNSGTRASLERLAEARLGAIALRVMLSLWPLCIVALCVGALRHWDTPPLLLFGTVIVLWALLSGGPHADIRLRSPIVPMMSVLAAVGLRGPLSRVRSHASTDRHRRGAHDALSSRPG